MKLLSCYQNYSLLIMGVHRKKYKRGEGNFFSGPFLTKPESLHAGLPEARLVLEDFSILFIFSKQCIFNHFRLKI